MNDNYAPPRANLDQSDEAKLSGSKGWFSSRPIPVYLIFLFSFFQIIAPAYLTFDGWHVLSQMFEAGVMTPLEFYAGFLFPALYAVAGILLLLMRKSAAFGFSFYFLWGLGKYISSGRSAPTIYDLIMTACIVAYCWWLYRARRLT